MNANGYSRKEICELIGKDKSVLSREFKRNSDGRNGEYKADLSQRKYKTRQAQKPKHQSFTGCEQKTETAVLKLETRQYVFYFYNTNKQI